jgi:nucleotide-binding universal stress UspA family protein
VNVETDILVGVDGSSDSDAAIEWAAREAAAHRCGLVIVHACDVVSRGLWDAPRAVRDELRETMRPIVDAAIMHANQLEPSIPARGGVLIARAGPCLVLLSERAQMTVIGRSGRGPLCRLLLGSVATRTMAAGHGSVVAAARTIGPPAQRHIVRVIAAVDEPATNMQTMQFAFSEADRHSAQLRIIQAIPRHDAGLARRVHSAEALTSWIARFPAVDVDIDIRPGSLTTAVKDACGPHDLLVLGHHPHLPVNADRLGWATTAVLAAAPCPVAIVHEATHAAEPLRGTTPDIESATPPNDATHATTRSP